MKKIVFFTVILFSLVSFGKEFNFTTLEYPPYISSELVENENSWVFNVVKEALKTQGYDKVSVNFFPWKRAYHLAKTGEVDAVYAASWTRERLESFEFSAPLGNVTKSLVKKKGNDKVNYNGDLESIKDYNIGIRRGFKVSEEFDKNVLTKKEVKDAIQGLKMLEVNRIDLFVISNEIDLHIIKKSSDKEVLNNIEILDPALSKQILYMAVSKNAKLYEEKLRDLNRGLVEIMLNGKYNEILKEAGM